MLWPIKNKSTLCYYSLLCINVVSITWRPADSNECRFGYHCRRRASNCCNLQRGSRNKLITHLFYNFIINPLMAASSNPFQRGSRGWGVFIYGNHATRRENGTSWWGCLCDVCFASKSLPSMSFLFPPERTWLAMLPTCWQHVGPTAKCRHFWQTRLCRADTKLIPTQKIVSVMADIYPFLFFVPEYVRTTYQKPLGTLHT